ncbi:STAS domain-containing protein [Rhodoferax aquaticus]|uniref:STAS domain-containing protein n=1 Tax=Rhodoferax aquaticus TaxID=2527691 RepID=A0A515EKB9_9BURK|nr:STAS domain-containing protein [Rhodoferax aquaticus]QDL53049.1 hypothetical protein EXZ61_02075 [Rhodoferax aquaticus]
MSDRFELPSELNIYHALEARDALLAWVSERSVHGADYLQISARHVEEVDGAGLQLLASLSNTEHSWRLVETSEAFTEACKTMGFAHWIDSRYLSTSPAGART